MKDINGVEIKTGDAVRISDSFFKNDNGLWFVEHSPGDVSWSGNDYCLYRLNKNGTLSVRKDKIAFWPLASYVSDREKSARAFDWNRENAKIEVVHDVDRSCVRDHFSEHAESMKPCLERLAMNWGKHSAVYINDYKIYRHYLAVAESVN